MPTQLVADDFENDTINADWADSTNFEVHSSGYMFVKNSGNHPNRRTTPTPDANQYVEMTIEADASSAAQLGGMCRMATGDLSGYGFMFRRSGNSEIFRTNTSGTDTTLGASFNETATTSAVFRLEVETIAGDVEVRLYKNGSLIQTRTDNSGSKITAAGRLGIFGNGGSSTTRMLDWSGGNLASSGPTGTSAMTSPMGTMAAAGAVAHTGTAAFVAPKGIMYVPLNHPGTAAFTSPMGVMAASGTRNRPPAFIDNFTTGLFNPTIQTYDPNWKIDAGDAVKVWEDHAYCNETAASGCSATYRGVNWSADHFAQATMVGTDSFTQFGGVSVRHQTLGDGQYYGYWSSGVSAKFFKADGGTLTDLVGSPSIAHQGDIVRIEAEGTTIRLFINNVLQHSVTDASYSGGTPGICGRNATNTGRGVDVWGGGNLTDILVTGTAAMTSPKGIMLAGATRTRINVVEFQAPKGTMAASGTVSSPVATQPTARWAVLPEIRYTNSSDICRPIVVGCIPMSLANQALPANQQVDIARVEFALSVNGGAPTVLVATRGDHKPTDVTENDPLTGWVASGGTGAFPVAASWGADIVMSSIAIGYFELTPTVIPANGTPIQLETYRYYNHSSGGLTLAKTGVVRYVDTAGSDSNDGLGTGTPMASMNAAAQSIKTVAGDAGDGTIYLMGQGTLHTWGGGSATGDLNCLAGGYLHIRPAPGVTMVRVGNDNGVGLRCAGEATFRIWLHQGVVHEGGLLRFSDNPAKTTWIVDAAESRAHVDDIMDPPSIRCRSAHYSTGEPWYLISQGTKRDCYVGSYFHDQSLGPWGAYMIRGVKAKNLVGIFASGNPTAINVECDNIGRIKRGYVNQANVPVDITVPVAGTMRIAERTAGAVTFPSPSADLQDIGIALTGSTAAHLQVSGAASQNNGHFAVTGSGNAGGIRYVEVANPGAVEQQVNVTLFITLPNGQDWHTAIHNDAILFSQSYTDALYWCCRFTKIDNEGRGIGSGSPLAKIAFFSTVIEYGDLTQGGSPFNAHCFENLGSWNNFIFRRSTLRGDAVFNTSNQSSTDVEFTECVFDGIGLLPGVTAGGLTAAFYARRNHFNGAETNAFGTSPTTGLTWIGALFDGNLQINPASPARNAAQYPLNSQWDLHDAGALLHVASGVWALAAVTSSTAAFNSPKGTMASAGVCRHTGMAAFVAPKGLLNAAGVGTPHLTGVAAFTSPRGSMAAVARANHHQVGTTGFVSPMGQMSAFGRGPVIVPPNPPKPKPKQTITEKVYNAIYDTAKAAPYYGIKIGSITIDTSKILKPSSILLVDTESDWVTAKKYGRALVSERKRWTWILKLGFNERISAAPLEQQLSDNPIIIPADPEQNLPAAVVRLVHTEYVRGPEQDSSRGDVVIMTLEASTRR